MNEEFLKFIWKNKLFDADNLVSQNGEKIEVIKTGFENFNAGPDFIDSRIKLNETVWAGNVEIHTKASDWNKHHHETNPAYNNVILHVVEKNDKHIKTENGREIPAIELKYKEILQKNYSLLKEQLHIVKCHKKLKSIPEFKITFWLERLLVERLENKSKYLTEIYEQTKGSWEETFYQVIAKSFGFKTNSLPFEMLAKQTPLKILAKHKNSLFQIEACLFGQAGFLEETDGDEYFNSLKKEYAFLKQKFSLQGIENHVWKFLRLRPNNFPTIRIAQFAALVHKSSALFSKILETEKVEEIVALFQVETSQYWVNHYQFNKASVEKKKRIGKKAIENIIINTVVPMLFVYGQEKGQEKFKIRALDFLDQLLAEKNSITNQWEEFGIKAKTAYQSQAILELQNEYCLKERCLHCKIGNELIINQ